MSPPPHPVIRPPVRRGKQVAQPVDAAGNRHWCRRRDLTHVHSVEACRFRLHPSSRILAPNILFISPTDGSLSLDDAYALVDPVLAPSVDDVAPEINAFGNVTAIDEFGARTISGEITGVTPEYREVRGYEVDVGDFIGIPHVVNASDVAVLGARASVDLFGGRNPVGRTIKVNGRQMTVIGVVESRGGGAFGFEDNRVLVPITTAFRRISADRTVEGGVGVNTISVLVGDVDNMERAEAEVSRILRLRHRITDEDDFDIRNQQQALEAFQETTQAFVLFLGAIASISLIVGGIGIMNIMLVSVTERTPGDRYSQGGGGAALGYPLPICA